MNKIKYLFLVCFFFKHTCGINWASQAALVVKNSLPVQAGSLVGKIRLPVPAGSLVGKIRLPVQAGSLVGKIRWRRAQATHSSALFWGNPMDRGAWQATVHGVTESQTQLQGLSMHSLDKSVTLWGFWKVLVTGLEICP